MRTLARRGWGRVLIAAAAAAAFAGAAWADTLTLTPVADSTLYSENGAQANGAGEHLFAGRTDGAELRRALLRFDLSAIPPGSTVSAVTLTMRCSRTRAATETVFLHRVTNSWGEGTSQAPGEEGGGGAAAANDATWTYRFYSTTLWATPGGEYVGVASASVPVGNANQFYSWSSAGMVSDVQSWINSPAGNYGWIAVGNESTNQTAKRFDSRQNTTASNRPSLTITYSSSTPTGACCLSDGSCLVTSATLCTGQGGTYQGDSTTCSPNPCPQPTGACCVGTVCSITTAAACTGAGGDYRGDGTTCTPNPCSPTGQVVLVSMKDNTLYESPTGALSNGAGQGFFAGASDNPLLMRRGLVTFDVSSIPSGAIITDVRLRLYMGYTQSPAPYTMSLYRVLADWGEGTSNATGNETGGAASATGDATWIHRSYNATPWATPGGDFSPTISGSLLVPNVTGSYEWASAGLIADVQAWRDGAAANYGWMLRGPEGVARSQCRFESRENADPTRRPQLTVQWAYAAPSGACCLPTGYCVSTTQTDCTAQGGTYNGDGVDCAGQNCPIILTPYVDALPLPGVAQPVTGEVGGAAHYVMTVTEQSQSFHSQLPMTRVWGYNGGYPGPTIVARRGLPVTSVWVNDLRDESGNLRTSHYLPVDTCIHGADSHGNTASIVTHLHGGHVSMESDGYPTWTVQPGQQSAVYTYPNNQPAGTVWYHDHALGITRLNVYMGMAGFYLIRDDVEDALNLPRGEFEIGMALQDRSFNPDGSLQYPATWEEHFFGDFGVVNGKVWPYFNVKQGKYRLRLLNGATSRTFTLALSNGATFWQIGGDLGLLEAPLAMTSVTISPGERVDVIMDFAPYAAGTEIIMTNSAPVPFPMGGMGPDIPNMMKFVVQGQAGDTDPVPGALAVVERIPENEAVQSRDFILRKMPSTSCGAPEIWGINDLSWHDMVEFPVLGTTEIWRWINRSGVEHPMHMHLVAFQVLDRQDFDVVGGQIVPVGPVIPPEPNEMSWKDTVQCYPNQITRVIARFEDFPGMFQYHCHILEHEEHEMMRQFMTVCATLAFTGQPGPQDVCEGDAAIFNVAALGTDVAYSWRKDGVPVEDGVTGWGSAISGATTDTLTISGVTPADAGGYDCLVTDACADFITSDAAALTTHFCAPACDPIDFNRDEVYPDTQDLFDFLSVFAGGACSTDPVPGCNDIDFNNDEVYPDITDVEAFLRVFGGGAC